MEIDNDKIANAVSAIIRDMRDRRGLKGEWERIDDGIQLEIRLTWAQIIKDALTKW